MNTTKECPRSRWVIVQREENNGIRFKKFKVVCNTWSCPVCSERKRWKLYKRIKKACPKKDFFMLTLTLKENDLPLDVNWQEMSEFWDILLKQLKRRFGKVRYFRCGELQKNNMPHYHMLIDCYLPKEEIQFMWWKITEFSFIAKFEKVRSSCAAYIMKYAMKSVDDIESIRLNTGKKTKIYVSSRNLLPVDISHSDWKLYRFCKIGESSEYVFNDLKKEYTWIRYGCTKPPDIFKDSLGLCDELFFSLYHLIIRDSMSDFLKCPVGKVEGPPMRKFEIQPIFDFS